MPKYLFQARYTTEGIQGLVNDSASGRRADVQAAVKALGGNVEAFYYAFGDDDVVTIVDLHCGSARQYQGGGPRVDHHRLWRGAGPDYASAQRRGCGCGSRH